METCKKLDNKNNITQNCNLICKKPLENELVEKLVMLPLAKFSGNGILVTTEANQSVN